MTRLNEAFDAVRASEALKTQTAQAVVREMRAGGARRRGRRLLPALAVAVCLLVAAGLGGHALYYTPTTVLSIDINPSLEMDINRFDRVIALNGYNDDGAALAAALDVQNWRYDEAVDALLANATIAEARSASAARWSFTWDRRSAWSAVRSCRLASRSAIDPACFHSLKNSAFTA